MHLRPHRYEREEHRETKRFLLKRFKGCQLIFSLPFSFNIHQTYTQHYILDTHSDRGERPSGPFHTCSFVRTLIDPVHHPDHRSQPEPQLS